MATIRLLPHLYSSVERGYRPAAGYGFQTVAVAEELVGTEDLAALEEAAFYAVPRERGEPPSYPVKEAFFRLPSGRYAIGRTVYSGTDALGRDGNYLAHHVVAAEDDLRSAGADPFAILDAAGLAAPGIDLTPRALSPVTIEVESTRIASIGAEIEDPEFLAGLASHSLHFRGTITLLLIGDEMRCRRILRTLFAALSVEDRLRLRFSTHFLDCDHLRSRFALAAVRSRAEAPAKLEGYLPVELDQGKLHELAAVDVHASWLAACLRGGQWAEIDAVNDAVDGLRAGREGIGSQLPPVGERACDVLWELAAAPLLQALPGEPRRVQEFLRRLSSPRRPADTLLATASPSQLFGPDAPAKEAEACLETLRATASPRAWRRWLKQWAKDPVLAPLLPASRPWWRRWPRRPGRKS